MNFEEILNFVRYQNEFIIYFVILLGSFVENIFPPFPGDTVTIAGAVVAGEGNASYAGVLASATAGGLIGALSLYYLGRIKGRKFFKNRKYFGESSLAEVEKLFSRFGDLLIVLSRFVVGVRSAISVAAGLGDVTALRMTVLTAASFIIWNCLLLGLVLYSKSNWELISEIGRKYNYVLIGALILAVAALVTRWLWRRK